MQSRCRRHGVNSLYPNSSNIVSTPNPNWSGRGGNHFFSALFTYNSNLTRQRRVVRCHSPSKVSFFTATNIGPGTKCGEIRYPRPSRLFSNGNLYG